MPVRRPRKKLSRQIPKHWYRGEPIASHVFDALSSTFPAGEAFFVRSVLHYRDRIDDESLTKVIRDFAAQEGQHSRVHSDHVELLLSHGYSFLAHRNRILDRVMRWYNRNLPAYSLAVTASLEHLTAILARRMLSTSASMTIGMHPEMEALWRWHALEEAEHKAVAFDVYQQVTPSEPLRALAHLMNSLGLSFEVVIRVVYMLWKDGQLFDRAVWRDGVRFLFGSEGLLRGSGDEWVAWFRRDFHPDEIDDARLIEAARPLVAVDFSEPAKAAS